MSTTTEIDLAALAATFTTEADGGLPRLLLSRVIEAHRAAMEANDLLARGLLDHDRYEAAANDRDDAIDAAAQYLGVA